MSENDPDQELSWFDVLFPIPQTIPGTILWLTAIAIGWLLADMLFREAIKIIA